MDQGGCRSGDRGARVRNGGLLALAVLALAATSAQASDGRIEISEVGVVGFPIVIGQPGSYVLTSNLTVPTFVTSAIRVDTDNVFIDLNGFRLDGPATCTSAGCNVPGGIAIDATGRSGISVQDGIIQQFGGGGIAADSASVRNVTVRETGGDGIRAGGTALVEGCRVSVTVGNGIRAWEDSIIRGNTVSQAGASGIWVGQGSVVLGNVVRTSVLAGLKADGDVVYSSNAFLSNNPDVEAVVLGLGWPKATGGNHCSDNSCYRVPMRWYYLTSDDIWTGEFADQVCEGGFHLASLWELHDPTALRYDTTRGYTQLDSGTGPPSQAGPAPGIHGWVRTGANSSGSFAGTANCNNWKSSSQAVVGTVVGLQSGWDPYDVSASPVNAVSPWIGFAETCDSEHRVWCVED